MMGLHFTNTINTNLSVLDVFNICLALYRFLLTKPFNIPTGLDWSLALAQKLAFNATVHLQNMHYNNIYENSFKQAQNVFDSHA